MLKYSKTSLILITHIQLLVANNPYRRAERMFIRPGYRPGVQRLVPHCLRHRFAGGDLDDGLSRAPDFEPL